MAIGTPTDIGPVVEDVSQGATTTFTVGATGAAIGVPLGGGDYVAQGSGLPATLRNSPNRRRSLSETLESHRMSEVIDIREARVARCGTRARTDVLASACNDFDPETAALHAMFASFVPPGAKDIPADDVTPVLRWSVAQLYHGIDAGEEFRNLCARIGYEAAMTIVRRQGGGEDHPMDLFLEV